MSDTDNERPRLRLEWLAIQRFREVAPGTRLEFAPGINLVLGMNGSGKTTLLDLIAACVRGNFSAYAEETFALRYSLRAGARRYEFEVANEEVEADPALREVMRAMPQLAPSRSARTHVTEFEGARERAHLTVTAERIVRGDEGHAEPFEIPRVFPLSPLACSVGDATLLMGLQRVGEELRFADASDRLHPREQRAATRFDEALGFFHAITAQSTADRPALAIMKMGAAVIVLPQMTVPASLLDGAGARFQNAPDHTFRLTEEHLPLLRDVAALAGFQRIEMAFAAPEVREDSDATTWLYRPPDFLCTREDGQVIRHNHLSFGQKRLLAFFYYAACNPDIVVADELVNGLHHGWIARSLQEIGDRQAFLTSQNPLLVDMVDFQGVDELRRSFVVCRADHEPDDPKRRLILRWRPLDAREAEELATLLAVDVQPASEILLAMGLW